MGSTVHQRYHRRWFSNREEFYSKQERVRYDDSDYAGDLDKRKSTTGYVFILS